MVPDGHVGEVDAKEQLIANARSFAMLASEQVAAAEEQRRLPAESVRGLIEAGFARAMVPARFGGWQLGTDSLFEAAREIAQVDASHAWCAGLLMEMSRFAAYTDQEAQEALWSDGPDVTIASSVIPATTVVRDGDGYRLNGQAPFASGSTYASWAFIAGLLDTPEGPDWCLFLVPSSEFEVIDTWATIGMRGTGSNTIKLEDVYVPGTRKLRVAELREGDGPGSRWHGLIEYRLPWVSFGTLTFIAPMLGATQGSLAAVRDWTRERATKGGAAMAELPTIQVKLAKAAADIDAAELLLRRAVSVTDGPEPPSLDLRARSLRDFTYSRQRLVGAIDTLMEIAGSPGFAEANALQRAWRDVHTMASHISMSDANYVHWSRMGLGLGLVPHQQWY